MNLVDIVALILILLSAILGFTRGLVREVLGVGAWVGALLAAIAGFPYFQPVMHGLIANPNVSDPVGFGLLFLVTLILLSILSHALSGLVRASLLSGLDRFLGIFFGAARGVALLIVAYVVSGLLVTSDHWSPEIRNARCLPYIYEGAVWVVQLVPEQMRPRLQSPPGQLAAPVTIPTASEE